jgi:hypothetical protein
MISLYPQIADHMQIKISSNSLSKPIKHFDFSKGRKRQFHDFGGECPKYLSSIADKENSTRRFKRKNQDTMNQSIIYTQSIAN